MVRTLLEQESEVNGIINVGKAGFSFIDVVLTATEELLYEGEATTKW